MLKDIVSHNKQKSIVINAVRNKKLPHAYLFAGAEGIGKKLFAVEFAKLVSCENLNNENTDSCGECNSCRDIDSNKNPDLILIQPTGNVIKIDQIREMKEKLYLKSFYNRYKTCIIDDADKMNAAASSALLKILEEPVGNIIFILIVTNIFSIFSTIISRCQILKFAPIKKEDIEGFIRSKNVNIAEEVINYAINIAEGSIGKAIYYMENNMFELRERIFLILDNLFEKGSMIDLKILKKEYEDKTEEIIDVLVSIYKDVLIFSIRKDKDILINSDKTEKIAIYSGKQSLGVLQSILLELDHFRRLVKSNISLNQELTINNILLKGVL